MYICIGTVKFEWINVTINHLVSLTYAQYAVKIAFNYLQDFSLRYDPPLFQMFDFGDRHILLSFACIGTQQMWSIQSRKLCRENVSITYHLQ